MSTVTVSDDFQIRLPDEFRKELNIRPGQKLSVLRDNGSLRIAPLLPIEAYRGIAKGMPTEGFREKKDREL
jgi:AbrB family looped-hinge helix DNA binding protein